MIRLYFNSQSIAIHQPLGQALDFRKLILKEITEGKKLTVIEIGLSPARTISQSFHHSRALDKPLPSHTDDSKELQVEGGVSQEEFRRFFFPHLHQMSGYFLKRFQRLFEFLRIGFKLLEFFRSKNCSEDLIRVSPWCLHESGESVRPDNIVPMDSHYSNRIPRGTVTRR